MEKTQVIKVVENECFIDSDCLAEMADKDRRSIARLINNHKVAVESFGVLRFEITKPSELGGRPKTTYLLNEEQATLIIAFMTNSPKVVEFKRSLVHEFYKMRNFIKKHEVARLAGIEARKGMTDLLYQSGEDERMHGRGYSNYTRLVYQMVGVYGKYAQYKKLYDKSGKFRESLTLQELERVKLAESLIKPLLEMDKQYSEIRDTLKPLFKTKEIDK